ncbi:MAG: ABC transporter substrate-binding protein, partial [Actinomycetota bacterium]
MSGVRGRVSLGRVIAVAGTVAMLASGCGARWSPARERQAIEQEPGPGTGDSVYGEETPGTGLSQSPGEVVSSLGEIAIPVGSSSPGTGTGPGKTPVPGATSVNPGPHPGVTDKEIKVCYLVPLTGAAPIPTSWDDGANLYWNYMKKKGRTIHGRSVSLKVLDTESNVATGLSVARDCVNQGYFTFVTLDRFEVAGAIGKFLHSKGIPNVQVQSPPDASAPDQTNTFTITVDHQVQGRLIADYWTNGDLKGKKYAVVREDVKELIPGTEALKARLAEKGIKLVYEGAVSGDSNDFSSTVLALRKADAQVVWWYGAPTPLIKLAQQSHAAAYDPVWFGNSISWNFDTAAQLGNANGALKDARVFSPWVAVSSPAANKYKAAYKEMVPNATPDDIGLVGWGVGEVLEAALQAAGSNLGYNTFRNAFQNLNVTPETWCPLRFGPGVRVGTTSVAEYRISTDHWVQVGTF